MEDNHPVGGESGHAGLVRPEAILRAHGEQGKAVADMTHVTLTRASNEGLTKVREDFTITGNAPTRASSWLKAPIRAFTFKTLTNVDQW